MAAAKTGSVPYIKFTWVAIGMFKTIMLNSADLSVTPLVDMPVMSGGLGATAAVVLKLLAPNDDFPLREDDAGSTSAAQVADAPKVGF